jgi:hypothetical protein
MALSVRQAGRATARFQFEKAGCIVETASDLCILLERERRGGLHHP